jgi:Domain of unknown function (DUF4349)
MNPHEISIEELAAELPGMREVPSQEFAARLDARAAAGFPGRRSLAGLLERLPGASTAGGVARRISGAGPRRKLLPALAGATSAIVIATALIVAKDQDGDRGGAISTLPEPAAVQAPSGSPSTSAPAGAGHAVTNDAPSRSSSAESIAPAPPAEVPGTAPGVRDRRIERSAELTLGTDPEHVQDVAAKVFDVVGRYRGIVLSSAVRDGSPGDAGADFELLIPSSRLSGALTDLSRIAEVRSRSENTLDITAPFVSARERLHDTRSEAEGLLRQLAAADTDAERESVIAQLKIVRGRIAAFRSQVDRLQRRANFSHLSMQITTGQQAVFPGAGGGDWTLGDALHDAGRVLAVAAGVALIALAVTLPLALLGGLGWTTRRIYLRRAREGALGT